MPFNSTRTKINQSPEFLLKAFQYCYLNTLNWGALAVLMFGVIGSCSPVDAESMVPGLPNTLEKNRLAQQEQTVAQPVLTPSEKIIPWLLPNERTKRTLNQIYEYDHRPLGKRMPVVLVPGRAEEFQQNSWWKGFDQVTQDNPNFQKRFKAYVFLYNSKEELDVQADSLVRDLKRRFSNLPASQPLMLVTYSLGGVISREALKDAWILNRVDTLIAIAVPFHGSPMFDPDWFSYYLNPPNRSPIRRFWDRTVYRYYMFSKSNLTRGLRWDNFDSSKPQFHAHEKLSPNHKIMGDQANSQLLTFKEYPNADAIRAKTVIYASYVMNEYTDPQHHFSPFRLPKYLLNHSLAFPKHIIAAILPFYGFTVHSVFTYMNNQLANLPTYTPENPQGLNTHLYRYNDGAIPMSSMMFMKARNKPYDEDLTGLLKLSTARQHRIFKDLDHMHLGEYAIIKGKLSQPDMLHPEDGVHSPIKWLVYDLLLRARLLDRDSFAD